MVTDKFIVVLNLQRITEDPIIACQFGHTFQLHIETRPLTNPGDASDRKTEVHTIRIHFRTIDGYPRGGSDCADIRDTELLLLLFFGHWICFSLSLARSGGSGLAGTCSR